MFSIGDFAHHGRVSVRMLRHYDAIGLLRPVHVDPASGYRYYEAGQLARLNRVIALKDLGFTLHQVQAILDDDIGADELRGMLRLRQADLEATMAAVTTRLARVETRLRTIESEGHMPTDDIVVKSVPAVRLAELTGRASGYGPEDIGPVIQPLYEELCGLLAAAGLTPTGPNLAYYEDAPGGDDAAVLVHAGVPVAAEPGGDHGLTIVDLPAIGHVATLVHRGSMEHVMPSVQALARWIDTNGYRSDGHARELYLDCSKGPEEWVTELQEPIVPA